MVGSSVSGDLFDDGCNKSIRKPNLYKVLKKPNNDVIYENINVKNVASRPLVNPFSQSEIEYQNIITTEDR